MAILRPLNDNNRSWDRARLIGHIVRSQYTVYFSLKRNRCKLSVPSEIITTPGRPRLLQNNVIKSLNKKRQQYDGLTYNRDKVNKIFGWKIHKDVITEGYVSIIDVGISNISVRNYTVLLVSQGWLSIDSNNATSKTNTRCTTEIRWLLLLHLPSL